MTIHTVHDLSFKNVQETLVRSDLQHKHKNWLQDTRNKFFCVLSEREFKR